ncbi:hypothetical protein CupriaWKF_06845 [Cupriavidus sp. WKF15]|uniref:hypothetical protein n=1 Tax=Cupriavidus sp. WKF15 TaxID=3032282 RepID=UPI0023E2B90C|nr:hypothetical protein [Cupriavidus sp. WKF15]WER47263.1 hypothetical protein CupriaWKF_06845 [Cupriavidus sp. WKF15]
MKGMRYNHQELQELRRLVLMERDILPLDQRIKKLRDEIRMRLRHVRALKAKGHPTHHSTRVLRLLCRTLAVERTYRKVMLKKVIDGSRSVG